MTQSVPFVLSFFRGYGEDVRWNAFGRMGYRAQFSGSFEKQTAPNSVKRAKIFRNRDVAQLCKVIFKPLGSLRRLRQREPVASIEKSLRGDPGAEDRQPVQLHAGPLEGCEACKGRQHSLLNAEPLHSDAGGLLTHPAADLTCRCGSYCALLLKSPWL